MTSPGEIIGPVGSTTLTSSTGTTDSNGELTMVYCSSDISQNSATSTITVTSGSAQATATVTFTEGVAVADNNVDITSQPETSFVGEQHVISVKYFPGLSATWTLSGGGTPIAGWNQNYNPTTATAPQITQYTNSSTFYLTTPGTATITANVKGTGADGKQKTGTTTGAITVQAPTDCTFSSLQNSVIGIFNIGTYTQNGITIPAYQIGIQNGIAFTYGGGSGGTLELAQIVTSCNITDGANQSSTNTYPGLDNAFPYSGGNVDNPTLERTYTPCPSEVNEDRSFTMYLMWKSNKASVPVEVMQIPWSFSADINLANNAITSVTKNPSSNGNSLSGSPASGLLTWSNIDTNAY
jgi:hypothetical protein